MSAKSSKINLNLVSEPVRIEGVPAKSNLANRIDPVVKFDPKDYGSLTLYFDDKVGDGYSNKFIEAKTISYVLNEVHRYGPKNNHYHSDGLLLGGEGHVPCLKNRIVSIKYPISSISIDANRKNALVMGFEEWGDEGAQRLPLRVYIMDLEECEIMTSLEFVASETLDGISSYFPEGGAFFFRTVNTSYAYSIDDRKLYQKKIIEEKFREQDVEMVRKFLKGNYDFSYALKDNGYELSSPKD